MFVVIVIALRYFFFFFFQAEDGIRDLVRSRGLGDVYKRQAENGIPGGVLVLWPFVPLVLLGGRLLSTGAAFSSLSLIHI